jgi:hypothetical protein
MTTAVVSPKAFPSPFIATFSGEGETRPCGALAIAASSSERQPRKESARLSTSNVSVTGGLVSSPGSYRIIAVAVLARALR